MYKGDRLNLIQFVIFFVWITFCNNNDTFYDKIHMKIRLYDMIQSVKRLQYVIYLRINVKYT